MNKGPDSRPAPPPGSVTSSVVAIGASGGQAEGMATLLRHLAIRPDTAVVLVIQHREALDQALIQDAAASRELAVDTVENGLALEGGHLYLCPPGAIVTIKNGRFRTRPTDGNGERGAIDTLLLSVAEEKGEDSIAVIMHGTAGDGTLGVAAVKESGGLTIAEALRDEPPADLSTSSSPAAMADFLLHAADIAARIAAHTQHLSLLRTRRAQATHLADMSGALGPIADILRNKTGHDFHGYKPQTFLRRVQRRMQVLQIDAIEPYIEHLRGHAEEVQNLFDDLLIGVTRFFRDAKEFEVLEREVIPRILDGKGVGDLVRIWVLGCATGEEAYSIGILLREQIAGVESAPHVQIFATDIDGRALAAARVGRYPASIASDIAPERLARWFVREGNTYVVVKELREMCIFSAHNVIRDAPFSKLDLISCRNLLIYLNAELQNRIIPLFHFALLPDRFLFLGSSENVTRHSKLFVPIDRRARIFKRLDVGLRLLPDFPLTSTTGRLPAERHPPTRRLADDSVARRAERIAERYAPAYVITDEAFEVLHFSGRTGRYIEPTSGAATLELLNLVHRDLRPDLRAGLMKAVETDDTVRLDRLQIGANGGKMQVDIVIEPMRETAGARRNFVVLFKDGPAVSDGADHISASNYLRDEHVQRLESELRVTRERLQATIEELETTNEELKSSNEEYQSLNEELQSANEELETSREELQSVNEELTTVNGELAHRVQELTRATSDLKNFFESTQIATLFLDNEMKVMNFTPAVTEIFHLIETDVGRPITHIRSRLAFEDLQDDIRRVLRTLGSVEREMDNPVTGTRYTVRILPYRSIDNFIAGVVITFVDVTRLTEAEKALRESEERFRTVAELSPDGILIEAGEQIVYANMAAARLIGASSVDTLRGRSAYELFQGERWQMRERIGALKQGEAFAPTPVDIERLDGDRSAVELAAGATTWGGDRAIQFSLRDLAERRQAEERQNLLLSELQHRVRNSLTVIRSIVRRTARNSHSVDDYRNKLDGRLNALARTQGMITRDVSSAVDLVDLLREELSVGADAARGRVQLEGPSVMLSARQANNIALALHELTTNALKHGAMARDDGTLAVEWSVARVSDGPMLDLTWQEHNGAPLPEPGRAGFGTELLKTVLAYELNARTNYDFGSDGVRWSLRLLLDET